MTSSIEVAGVSSLSLHLAAHKNSCLFLVNVSKYGASLFLSNNDCNSLFLCVDEYWDQHPELHDIPIYYASSLAKKCMAGITFY